MAMSGNIKDREFAKFVQSPTRANGSAVEITGDITTTAVEGPFSPPTGTDFIGRSVSSNVETYEYRAGGSGGTLLKTIVVTYVASDLADLLKVEVS